MVGVVIPAKQINLTQSLLVGYDDLFRAFGMPWAAPLMAVALAFGVLGGVTVWVAGPSAGIATVGRAGYLPPFFQKLNKNGMATNILILQGLIVTFLAIMFVITVVIDGAFLMSYAQIAVRGARALKGSRVILWIERVFR